jgi:molybdenum cofactor cytidylyltransferase
VKIAAVLLAAGHSSRFGGDKLAQPLPNGRCVALASAHNLLGACDTRVAVVRQSDQVLGRALAELGFKIVSATAAHNGMGASLALGVSTARNADGWLIALADMPWIKQASIVQIASALRRGADLAAPYHQGQRGHPVGFGKRFYHDLIGLDGDSGARSILQCHLAAIQRVTVDDAGVLRDIDRPADLAQAPG